MHSVRGQLFDGETARSREATLQIFRDGSVRLTVEAETRTLRFDELAIGARLGDTPRSIGLPGGGQFETLDNAGIDAALRERAAGRRNWIHFLESRLGLVLGATLLVLAAGGAFVVWGVPVLAKQAAFAVSPELSARLEAGTLEILDRSLDPSGLPQERRDELSAHFAEIWSQAPPEHDFRLLFRSGGPLGANAFALPSGTILLTDELVGLAARDEEIVAVLAHEVGHVVHRHGLRQVIQSSLLAIAILLLTGDLSSTSGFVAALPAALAEARFSRDFEREADDYAVAYLSERGIAPAHFAALLTRLSEAAGESEGPLSFLDSHPATDERVRRFER